MLEVNLKNISDGSTLQKDASRLDVAAGRKLKCFSIPELRLSTVAKSLVIKPALCQTGVFKMYKMSQPTESYLTNQVSIVIYFQNEKDDLLSQT